MEILWDLLDALSTAAGMQGTEICGFGERELLTQRLWTWKPGWKSRDCLGQKDIVY